MLRPVALLEQQELVEVPPRRMIVQRGSEAHCGVDVSTRAVSIATVLQSPENGLQRLVVTVPFERGLEGGLRLARAHKEIRVAVSVALLNHRLHVPGFVFVEQPSGKFDNPNLSYMVGVTMAAVVAGVHDGGGVTPVVETVTSSSWKKKACGRGNLFKPKRGDKWEYGVLTWARLNGYAGSSFDEADAWAIAEAARRTVALEVR